MLSVAQRDVVTDYADLLTGYPDTNFIVDHYVSDRIAIESAFERNVVKEERRVSLRRTSLLAISCNYV